METIEAVAVKYGDLILSVEKPGRHHHVFWALDKAIGGQEKMVNGRYPFVGTETQGFITSTGRFVDRIEGCKLARAADQIKHKTGPADMLFSDCMW
jgi:hypothetical protein